MTREERIKETATFICSTYGKVVFSTSEVADIVGIHANFVSNKFFMAGEDTKKIGKEKKYTAIDIATFMYTNRIAPIDNTSRGG